MQFKEGLSLKRAVTAIGGAAGISIANLYVSLLMIGNVSQEEYGVFALMLVIQSLACGFSNAILNSPLLIVITNNRENKRDVVWGYQRLNFLFCLVMALMQLLVSYLLLKNFESAFLFCFLAFFAVFRWFGRAYLNNCDDNYLVVRSDFSYFLFSVFGSSVLLFIEKFEFNNVLLILSISQFISIGFFGQNFIAENLKGMISGKLQNTVEGFLKQGRFALLGVLSAEATSNSHAYIVSALFGPAAYAPIAAANLVFRPLDVAFSTMTQLERPRIRKLLHQNRKDEVTCSLKKILLYCSIVWCGILLGAISCNFLFFEMIYKDAEYYDALTYSFGIFLIIYIFRMMRSPIAIYLQSADNFRVLSNLSLLAGGLTLVLVSLSSFFLGTAFSSLLGVALGEFLLFLMLRNIYRRLNNE
ncbi:hypothetical protein [Lacimicrobium alkaliphilum]|uniref:hypothetical protein n=1 Tax=Lacimicrobium alkaliphilum TaxID=1526571 RepID=UPI000BFED309|nr:hypothetical protein [Lacimicrobium alkaliphilum]